MPINGIEKDRPIDSLGIGVFDGMHLGHQEIYKRSDAMLTFSPHPDILLGKKSKIKFLSTAKELDYYIDYLLTLDFNKNIANLTARDFLDHIIWKYIQPKKIVFGYDFKFGYKREGDLELLQKWANEKDVEIIRISPIIDKNQKPIKSSLIRTYMENEFDKAIEDIGHSYLIIGKVVKGDNRGKKLGFPTANLEVHPEKLIPGSGVYKGYIKYKNQKLPSIIYIGQKPTFKSEKLSIEVHIINFSQAIYDHEIHLFLESKIRNEMVFNSEEELVRQIRKDLGFLFSASSDKSDGT